MTMIYMLNVHSPISRKKKNRWQGTAATATPGTLVVCQPVDRPSEAEALAIGDRRAAKALRI